MSRQFVERPQEDGRVLVTYVASPVANLSAFSAYMNRLGLADEPGMIMHAADYRKLPKPRSLQVAYFEHGRHETENGHWIQVGPLLVVSGIDRQQVESEMDKLLKQLGETEDPESVNYFVARMKRDDTKGN